MQNFFKAFNRKKIQKVCFRKSFRVLYQHILRTQIIASLWKNNTNLPSPLDFGWEMKDGMFDIKWFEGEQYPANIDITTVDNAATDDGNNDGDLEQQYASNVDENADDDDNEDDFNNFIYLLLCAFPNTLYLCSLWAI